MSRVWFTADTHFGHGNIIKYCARQCSWDASFHGSWHVYGHVHGRLLEEDQQQP